MRKDSQLSLLFIAFYLFVRFPFDQRLYDLSPYASYLFECFFIGLVYRVFQEKWQWKGRTLPKWEIPLSFLAGFCIFHLGSFLGISIPFSFQSLEVILFLLLIGPILEELLFRQTFWVLLSRIFKNPRVVLVTTALLFSFGHFYAFFRVPEFVYPFIFYQAAYTFLLGLWWGYRRNQNKNITQPIALHMSLNFGFFLGSFF